LRIKDLKPGMQNVDVEGTITKIGRTRSFISRKTGRRVFIAEAVLEDDSGSIVLVLWNQQIRQVNKGDRVAIKRGYVKEYRGVLQLNVGREGKILKI